MVTDWATPGATVALDVGSDIVETSADDDGTWTASIARNSELSERQGWIYGLIRKGKAEYYIKLNVLDTCASVAILFDELPRDSLLR